MLGRVFSFFRRTPPRVRNQKQLDNIHFSEADIPDEFICPINHEVMNEPEIVTTLVNGKPFNRAMEKKAINDWIMRSNDPQPMDPCNRLPIIKKEPDARLQQSINEFVDRHVNAYTALQQIREAAKQTSHCHHFTELQIHGYSQDNVPTTFIDHFLSNKIMDYPVVLDDNPEHVVDFFALDQLWKQGPEYEFINPYTGKRFTNITFHADLHQQISQFVERVKVETIANIKHQISVIENTIGNHILQESNASRLCNLENNKVKLNTPGEFFDANNEIMTHPIIMDGEYIIDYKTLKSFWNEKPEYQYLNYFTYQPIKSLVYHSQLQEKIELFFQENEKKHMPLHWPQFSFLSPPSQIDDQEQTDQESPVLVRNYGRN